MEKRNNPLNAMNPEEFSSIFLSLAPPSKIEEWSHGEVTKPETINYRTQRSEKDGLFDEKIFGPEKDYECYCSKYRGVRYKGVVCEKCGVEVTRSIVRRERMGHIGLATVSSHVWFLRGVPSRMALILGAKKKDLEKVIYFSGYIVTSVDETARQQILTELDQEYKDTRKTIEDEKELDRLEEHFSKIKTEIEELHEGQIIDDVDYERYIGKYSGVFNAAIGAEAIYNIFKEIDLKKLADELEEEYQSTGSKGRRKKLRKRLSLINSMIKANIRPEWMFLKNIPVLPPSLRPMVALEGGRHATSDVNDLYRRVINRNNRLAKLQQINAPHVILRNEKRILQEAVDALIDNSIRRRTSYASTGGNRRALKSLADNLKSKQGIFRQNLLGKRVDYSGRSVIVIGPELALDECGLPKHMALELFRPFVIQRLLEDELAYNIRGANKLIDEKSGEVWEILESVTSDKYVLLNRAPTLHRLGIQAFKPILIEGHAIQVHPLVCAAFNADFDGDQMAVHVPLSDEAQYEAREIMAANTNLLRPGTGRPIVSADKDIILGVYWMTRIIDGKKGEGEHFASINDAITAYDYGAVDLRARIKVMKSDKPKYADLDDLFETSVGRLLFNSVLPVDFPFVNEEVASGVARVLVEDLIDKYGVEETPDVLDAIKTFGFQYATHAGITWGLDEISIPEAKKDIIEEAQAKADEVVEHYNEGLLSAEERRRQVLKIWHEAKDKIEEALPDSIDPNGSLHDMLASGARGSIKQVNTMAGMKGLIVNNEGEAVEHPVITSSSEGHTPTEYFVTTHGSRKGLTDTALKTATAGFLTRRLFDVAQDVVISAEDCGVKKGVVLHTENLEGIVVPISQNSKGRYLLEDVVTESGKKLFSAGDLLTRDEALSLDDEDVNEVVVRSPMKCEMTRGICKKCYGIDLTTNLPVELGEAVGTIAAQAIGEPGTQLTMRTFHAGGTASVGGDITTGLPRVEQLFEARKPKSEAIISHVSGTITDITTDDKKITITVLPNVSDRKGKSSAKKDKKGRDTDAVNYSAPARRTAIVEEGEEIEKGQLLTDGAANLQELFKFAGQDVAQDYIIREVSQVYERQGASISRKHIEVVIKQMFSRVQVTESGDTDLARGDTIEIARFLDENEKAREEGGKEAEADLLIKGISRVALSRDSFLSAASFQHSTRTLIDAAVRGSEDKLVGLKENVIIGRLIPAGTGFAGSPKQEAIANIYSDVEDVE